MLNFLRVFATWQSLFCALCMCRSRAGRYRNRRLLLQLPMNLLVLASHLPLHACLWDQASPKLCGIKLFWKERLCVALKPQFLLRAYVFPTYPLASRNSVKGLAQDISSPGSCNLCKWISFLPLCTPLGGILGEKEEINAHAQYTIFKKKYFLLIYSFGCTGS